MTTKLMISVSLLLASIVAQAVGTLPQGRWKVTQIAYENNTDGNIETVVYDAVANMNSYIHFPQELEINDLQRVVLHYPNSLEDATGEYTLEDGQLLIKGTGIMQRYQYTLNDDMLSLTIVQRYEKNLPTGGVEQVVETWTMNLKKQ